MIFFCLICRPKDPEEAAFTSALRPVEDPVQTLSPPDAEHPVALLLAQPLALLDRLLQLPHAGLVLPLHVAHLRDRDRA